MKATKAQKPIPVVLSQGTAGSVPAATPATQQQTSGITTPKAARSWSKVAASSSANQNVLKAVNTTNANESKDHEQSAKKSAQVRLNSYLDALKNLEVEISLRDGKQVQGIVQSIVNEPELKVVLVETRRADATSNGSGNSLTFGADEVVEIHASRSKVVKNSSSAWKTDVDISGAAPRRERELQAWQPPPESEGVSLEDELSSRPSTSNKKWDQFAANEQLFGVKSQWDEDVYTHKLDTSRPDFAARQAEAAKLAKEIEQSASSNPHVLEERGVEIDDSGVTEEDKYSGVQRSSNAWLPPARRNVVLPSRASPVDPAIISSQLATPSSASGTPKVEVVNEQGAPVAKPANPIESHIMAQFKQFATGERDRLAVKKAATFKKEKDGRLQDLMKFSKDFKLNTPVPEDLVPILAKDKAKQDAIVQKAASSAAVPSKEPGNTPQTGESLQERIERVRLDPSSQAPPTPLPPKLPPTRTTSSSSQAPAQKLKAQASEFKPFNPAASSFMPSYAAKGPPIASPALSTASSQPRQTQYNAEAIPFFTKKPKPPSERAPILDAYNPFVTYKKLHPDATIAIEPAYKTTPAWPCAEDAPSLHDPPKDIPRPRSSHDEIPMSPIMNMPLYQGSAQQMYGFQGQPAYYGGKAQQPYIGHPAQFNYNSPQQYQQAPAFIYPNRGMPGPMMPMHYPQQMYNAQMSGVPQYVGGYGNGSPRQRQVAPQHNRQDSQRSPEVQKSPRPPPMGGPQENRE